MYVFLQMKRSKEPEPGPSSFSCPFCDERYSSDEERRLHIEAAHRNRIENKVE